MGRTVSSACQPVPLSRPAFTLFAATALSLTFSDGTPVAMHSDMLKHRTAGALTGLFLIASLTGAGEVTTTPIGNTLLMSESKLELFGDSTVHKFSSRATVIKLDGKIETDPAAPGDGLNMKPEILSITIPITGLKSDNSTLDEHLADAMKADKFPEIRGLLKSYEVKGKNADNSFKVLASVDLTMAGTTKTVPIEATVTRDGGKIHLKGEKQLLMTDFNIDPPTMMLGVIKADNEILVRFDLVMSPQNNTDKGEK